MEEFAACFQGAGPATIRELAGSFRFANCLRRGELASVLAAAL